MEENEVVETTEVTADTAAEETEHPAETSQEAQPAFVPDDDLVERGIRAGMKLADVQALPSKEMAERIIGAIEAGAKGGKGATAENGETDGDAIPAIDISGFDEENGYDPKLIGIINSLKSTVEAQQKTIAKLRAGSAPKAKVAVAESRRNMTLARPGGETGKTRKETPASAEADILSELRRDFKLN